MRIRLQGDAKRQPSDAERRLLEAMRDHPEVVLRSELSQLAGCKNASVVGRLLTSLALKYGCTTTERAYMVRYAIRKKWINASH